MRLCYLTQGVLKHWLIAGIYQIYSSTGSRGVDYGSGIFAVVSISLSLLIRLLFSLRSTKQWESDVSADFEAALSDMGISSHTFLVDRTVVPSYDASGGVYRILLDQEGRYFLYMSADGTTGLITPLSKERALIAAKMNGYQTES